MILTGFGKLSVAQAPTTNTNTVSTNVIDLALLKGTTVTGVGSLDNVWAAVQTAVPATVAAVTATYKVSCRLSTVVGLTANYFELASVTCTRGTDGTTADPRVTTAGKYIMRLNIGKAIAALSDPSFIATLTDPTSPFRYLGFYYTLADGTGASGITVNAAISPTEMEFLPDSQATISGRTTTVLAAMIPDVASVGSDTNA